MTAPARGLTLIELMVAGAIGVVVLCAATLVVDQVAQQYGRAKQLSEMRRSAGLVMAQLGSEFRLAGLGVPTGLRIDGLQERFPPAVVGATASSITFMADVPRPDSPFNGVSMVSDVTATLPLTGLALLNDATGSCQPYLPSLPCATNATSLLFDSSTASCGSSASAPSCPWSLSRYRTSELLIVVNTSGWWTEAAIDGASVSTQNLSQRYLKLTPGLPVLFWTSPVALPIFGSVSTPDRIHYRLSGGAVQRDQCWDSVGSPAQADALNAAECALGDTTGTGWESLATGVTQFSLTLFDGSINAITLPLADADMPRVARLQVALTLQRQLGTTTLSYSEQGEFAMRTGAMP